MPVLMSVYLTIGTAKVSTSAFEGYGLGILRKGVDEVSMNQSRRIADAKQSVIDIFDAAGIDKPEISGLEILSDEFLLEVEV